MAYAILRFAKHKGGASKALSAHHERTKEVYASNPDPDLQPTPHGVGLGPSVVDTDVFFDGFLQLFFYFRLRLTENILDDGLLCFGIVTDGVASFPTSVLSFADSSLIA